MFKVNQSGNTVTVSNSKGLTANLKGCTCMVAQRVAMYLNLQERSLGAFLGGSSVDNRMDAIFHSTISLFHTMDNIDAMDYFENMTCCYKVVGNIMGCKVATMDYTTVDDIRDIVLDIEPKFDMVELVELVDVLNNDYTFTTCVNELRLNIKEIVTNW